MSETRKLAAILAADIAGYSRLTATDEERTVARLRGLRTDLIDPAILVHHGHVVKRTGDGFLIEFRSVVDAVRCAIEVQNGMTERNAGLPPERQILFRIGIHLGDVIEEADGDLMGDGINIASRLENICEPGSICLSEDAYRQVKSRLDLAVTDRGNKELKNIPETVQVFAIDVGRPGKARPAEPPRLSMVVLPFANIGGDPDQEYFVDGVTESLTTDLSRIAGSFVIGRNTAFTYKGKPVDLRQIGRELNIRYVIEGSVQRSGNRLRVNVQLIEAESGAHLWAERFDKPVTDLFDNEIIARLANELNAQLIEAEARRTAESPDPDSTDLYFQGMAWANRGNTAEYCGRARALFERSLALDPGNVDALVARARIDAVMIGGGLADDRDERLGAAEAGLTQALSLAPNHASAHMWLALVYNFSDRLERSIAECEKSLALDQNLAHAHALVGLCKARIGRAGETESHVLEAFRLSPRDNNAYAWEMIAGLGMLCVSENERAAVWLTRSIETNRNLPVSHFFLAAALAHLGLQEGALAAARAGLALEPSYTIRRARMLKGFGKFEAQTARIFDGMRKAGVPEG